MTVLELASKLGEALESSAEFQRMKQAEAAQADNAQAQQMMDSYATIREDITRRAQADDVTPEQMMQLRNEMQRESDKLMQNNVVAEYVDSMQRFNTLMATVNQIIGSYIAPEKHAGCSDSDCAACSGCGS